MFEYTLACASKKRDGKKWPYFLFSTTVWLLALSGSFVGSIFLYNAQLNERLSLLTMLAPPPPPPPPPPARPSARPRQIVTTVMRPTMMSVRNVPTRIDLPASERSTLVETSMAMNGVEGGVPGGVEGGVVGGVLGGVLGGVRGGVEGGTRTIPPPPPPRVEQPEPPPQPAVVRRSEGVIRGNALVRAVPEYPPIAIHAHIQGDVQIEVTISEEGNVTSARVISGNPLLQQSALTAAWQWKFKPTLLNNEPVIVKGVLTFRYTLPGF